MMHHTTTNENKTNHMNNKIDINTINNNTEHINNNNTTNST